jgi:hypothetical protein
VPEFEVAVVVDPPPLPEFPLACAGGNINTEAVTTINNSLLTVLLSLLLSLLLERFIVRAPHLVVRQATVLLAYGSVRRWSETLM